MKNEKSTHESVIQGYYGGSLLDMIAKPNADREAERTDHADLIKNNKLNFLLL